MVPPELDFRRLKRLVTIEQVLASRGFGASLRRQGPRLVGPCPLHGGDNPNAFVLSPEVQLWRCFSKCRAGGDVVELVRRLDGVDYLEVARRLAALAGLPAPPPAVWGPLPPRRPAAAPFHPFPQTLPLDPHCGFLQRKGITPQTATRFEVGRYHGGGFLSGCVAVRLHDLAGRPLGYLGRRLQPESARCLGKWKLPPALPKSRLLYNYHRILPRPPRALVLTECPWSVMRLAQLRIPAVALLGTHLSPEQGSILARVPTLILLLDGDPAGRSAARLIAARLAPAARIATIDDELDPDDLSDTQLLDIVRRRLRP